MAQGSAKNRVLKVGLVQDGKLIEELQLKPKTPVDIGLDPQNMFVIGSGDWPKKHLLLEPTGELYTLHVLPGMRGMVSIGDQMVDLEKIESFSGATKKGKGWTLKLTPDTKGKAITGDTTVLFQLVSPSTLAAPMKLPRELRGGLVRSFDLHFLILLIFTFLLHIATVKYAESIKHDAPELNLSDQHAETVKIDLKNLDVEEEKPPENDEGEGDQEGKKGDPGRKQPGPKGPSERGILAIITQASGEGSVADLFADGTLGEDITGALDNLAGVRVAVTDVGTRTGLGGGGNGEAVDIGGMGSVGSDAKVDMRDKGIKRVGSVRQGAVQSQGKLDRRIIAEQVKRYLAGIKACYERVLKQDPNLAGKVTVRFTIGTDGRVTKANIVSSSLADEQVKQCILRRIKRWKFPKPDEGTVTVSYPFIFTAVK